MPPHLQSSKCARTRLVKGQRVHSCMLHKRILQAGELAEDEGKKDSRTLEDIFNRQKNNRMKKQNEMIWRKKSKGAMVLSRLWINN